jgi:molybdate transport system substrate-binding protein
MWLRNLGRGALACVALLAVATRTGAQEPRQPVLLVFAAASLTNVLEDLSGAWEKQSGVRVRFSFAASSALARQIEAGGNADVFVSADEEWMDYLASRSLIDDASRRDVAGNRLVLIAPADSPVNFALTPGLDLTAALGDGRLAIADPDIVPAGRYARAALTTLGAWNAVSRRLVRAENVRAALIYVARGECPLGIVYSTDAQIEPKVRVVTTFPDHTHAPITYPAAATVDAGPLAAAFIAYLSSANAAPVWKKHGFRELIK